MTPEPELILSHIPAGRAVGPVPPLELDADGWIQPTEWPAVGTVVRAQDGANGEIYGLHEGVIEWFDNRYPGVRVRSSTTGGHFTVDKLEGNGLHCLRVKAPGRVKGNLMALEISS